MFEVEPAPDASEPPESLDVEAPEAADPWESSEPLDAESFPPDSTSAAPPAPSFDGSSAPAGVARASHMAIDAMTANHRCSAPDLMQMRVANSAPQSLAHHDLSETGRKGGIAGGTALAV